MWQCKACGNLNEDAFCTHCGALQPQEEPASSLANDTVPRDEGESFAEEGLAGSEVGETLSGQKPQPENRAVGETAAGKQNKTLKILLITAICLAVVVGGLIGGYYIVRAVQGGASETVTYTVCFNVNGGSGTPGNQVILANDRALKPTLEPTRGDMVFQGWYLDGDCTKAYDFTSSVTSDLVLFAGWTVREETGTVEGTEATNYNKLVAPPSSNVCSYAWIWTQDGQNGDYNDSVNLRKGPGKKYKTICKLYYMESIYVLYTDGSWSYISSYSSEGWIKNSYISYGFDYNYGTDDDYYEDYYEDDDYDYDYDSGTSGGNGNSSGGTPGNSSGGTEQDTSSGSDLQMMD